MGWLSAPSTLLAEELRGRIELLAKGGKSIARDVEVRQAVVWFDAATPKPTRAPEVPFEMVTRGKEFQPRVLAIPRGSKVRFPNADPILHNVFSVSGSNGFDLGLIKKGESGVRRFDAAGVVRIFCNVHHAMVAYVVVLATPFFARPEADGSFVLRDLPRGAGKLTVWHEQAEPLTINLPAGTTSAPALRLEIVRPRIPAHVDKRGRSYFRDRREVYGGG